MYKLPDGQLDIYTLIHPLEDMLDPENRWVVRAGAMPWEELERVLPNCIHRAERRRSLCG